MNKNQPPKWEHDCEDCVFLGSFDLHDLYYCEEGNPTPTVIARFGSDEPNYRSGMPAVTVDIHLREAYFRAKEQGLIQG